MQRLTIVEDGISRARVQAILDYITVFPSYASAAPSRLCISILYSRCSIPGPVEWSGQAPKPEGTRRSRMPHGQCRSPASEGRKQHQHERTSAREKKRGECADHLSRLCHPPLAFGPARSVQIRPALSSSRRDVVEGEEDNNNVMGGTGCGAL